MENKVNVLKIAAAVEKLSDVLFFVDSRLEEIGCSMKVQMQIDVTLEELFVNIAKYAYPDSKGEAEIRLNTTPEYVEITLIDSGIPYDPLAKPDPDITLSAKERAIGGLGIFMSKKMMDEITYQYRDNKNMLTLRKNLK